MALPDGVTTIPLVASVLGFPGPFQESDVWTGTNYFAGATYYAAGSRFHDVRLRADGIKMASAVATQVRKVDQNGFVFNTPEAWKRQNVALYTYPGYERPLHVWDLMDTIKPLSNVFAEGPRNATGR